MSTTMANVDAILKNDYQPIVREQLVNKWALLAQLERNSKDVEGRYAVLSLHVGRNSGVGARPAGGQLPTAGRQSYVEQRVPITRNYGTIAIDGDVIYASASDKGSFGRVLEREIKGVVTDLKRDVNRQLYNDSTKAIAQCGVTSSDTEIVLTNPTAAQMLFFEEGMVIDIGTTANTDAIVASAEITAVGTNTITIDSSVTTTSSHYIYRAGSDANELTGLREIVAASGTLFNVNPSSVAAWKSTRNHNSGTNRTPTEAIFEKVIEDVDRVSNEAPNLIMTSHGVRRNLAAQYQGQRRYTDTVQVKAGFSALTVAAGTVELPIMVDRDCPDNTAFVLNTNHLTHHEMGPSWSWMERDGSVLHLKQGYDQYVAQLFNYHELTTDRRNAHAIVEDLTEA